MGLDDLAEKDRGERKFYVDLVYDLWILFDDKLRAIAGVEIDINLGAIECRSAIKLDDSTLKLLSFTQKCTSRAQKNAKTPPKPTKGPRVGLRYSGGFLKNAKSRERREQRRRRRRVRRARRRRRGRRDRQAKAANHDTQRPNKHAHIGHQKTQRGVLGVCLCVCGIRKGNSTSSPQPQPQQQEQEQQLQLARARVFRVAERLVVLACCGGQFVSLKAMSASSTSGFSIILLRRFCQRFMLR